VEGLAVVLPALARRSCLRAVSMVALVWVHPYAQVVPMLAVVLSAYLFQYSQVQVDMM
jgi:hypothetical protein